MPPRLPPLPSPTLVTKNDIGGCCCRCCACAPLAPSAISPATTMRIETPMLPPLQIHKDTDDCGDTMNTLRFRSIRIDMWGATTMSRNLALAAVLSCSALVVAHEAVAQPAAMYQGTTYKGREIGKLTGDVYYARYDDYLSAFMVTPAGIVLVE